MDVLMRMLPYVLNITSALILAFATKLFAKMQSKKEAECKNEKYIQVAVQAMLRDRLVQKCEYHITQKWCSSENKTVLEKMHTPYESLGGNDVVTNLYNQTMVLPIYPPQEEKKNEQETL